VDKGFALSKLQNPRNSFLVITAGAGNILAPAQSFEADKKKERKKVVIEFWRVGWKI
jgi:hypothetical protein